MELQELLTELSLATLREDGSRRGEQGIGTAVRQVVKQHHGNPLGDGDKKTACPGTYRPVGKTCPSRCPYLGNGCYAQSGNVAIHALTAAQAQEAALVAAVGAMTWAALTQRPCRLHVSGDFGQTWEEAEPYVQDLIEAAAQVRHLFGPVQVWTYTHLPQTELGTRLVQELRDGGIYVRWSDFVGPGGAIVASFEDLPNLREEYGQRIAKCPAQLRDVTCADCGLCWTHPDLTIAFTPHGVGARKVKASSPAYT